MDETGLVGINEAGDEWSDAVRQHLGDKLHGTVLERDRPEGVRGVGTILFWQEDQECSV